MNTNFKNCLAFTLSQEGGYVDNPDDPGGATNKGITHRVYNAWRQARHEGFADVRNITDDEVAAIYRENYWNKCGAENAPPGVDLCLFDYAVNSGPSRTALLTKRTIADICAARLSFLKQLTTWKKFGKGWTKRVEACKQVATQMSLYHAPDRDAKAPQTKPPQAAPTTSAKVVNPTGAKIAADTASTVKGKTMPQGVIGALLALLYEAPTLVEDFEKAVADIKAKSNGQQILTDVMASVDAIGAAVKGAL